MVTALLPGCYHIYREMRKSANPSIYFFSLDLRDLGSTCTQIPTVHDYLML